MMRMDSSLLTGLILENLGHEQVLPQDQALDQPRDSQRGQEIVECPSMTEVITIFGPTASGKSRLAVETALAQNGEIISVDSRQVYRELSIGTGKITEIEIQ